MSADLFSLADKVVLVTGASRGIGAAIASDLARQGARVFGTATTEEGAARITAALAGHPVPGTGVVLEVRDGAASQALIDRIVAEHGKLSVLVNNAGITRDNLAMRMKDDEWDDVIATNLSAVFRLSRQAIRPMMKARTGRIINITSVVGQSGNPGQANYAAAKAGAAGMARALARELGSRGITVNCVAPGFIETAMTDKLNDEQKGKILTQIPAGRMGSAQEIAAAVLYLSSAEAGYVTGATLHVNGGMAMV